MSSVVALDTQSSTSNEYKYCNKLSIEVGSINSSVFWLKITSLWLFFLFEDLWNLNFESALLRRVPDFQWTLDWTHPWRRHPEEPAWSEPRCPSGGASDRPPQTTWLPWQQMTPQPAPSGLWLKINHQISKCCYHYYYCKVTGNDFVRDYLRTVWMCFNGNTHSCSMTGSIGGIIVLMVLVPESVTSSITCSSGWVCAAVLILQLGMSTLSMYCSFKSSSLCVGITYYSITGTQCMDVCITIVIYNVVPESGMSSSLM